MLIKRISKYIKPYIFKLICLFLCILSGILFSLIQPLLWGEIIAYLFNKDINSVYINIVYIIITSTLQLIINFIESYLFHFITNNIVYDLKTDMYKQILDFPIKVFDKISVGELISRLQEDTASIARIITNQLLTGIVDILKIIIIGIAMIKISLSLSILALATFPISYLIFLRAGRILREKIKGLSKINDNYFKNIEQTLTGIKEIRSMGIKSYVYNTFCSLSKNYKESDLNVNIINDIFNRAVGFLNLIFKMLIIFVGSKFILNGALCVQHFIAFSTYSDQLGGSLMNVTKLNSTFQQIFVSIERIFYLMDNLSYSAETYENINVGKVNGNISFKNVDFKYDEYHILKNINFDISANSKVAIVGNSGSGKTTIFNLLLRFYEVSSGEITIDGINIKEFSESSLRDNIAIVRQEPFMFNLSIKENLLIINNTASDEELFSACKQAYIHDYIMSLPEQYNTIIGGNSSNISGGQKQRLATARAILKNSKIILFDEITSGLDNITQSYIQRSIDKISENHTVIVVAHRLSTIINSDLIIVMENGEVVGYGKHDDLIKENLRYKELYNAEFKKL